MAYHKNVQITNTAYALCPNNEYRVSLMPQHIAAIAQTHKVIVQQDAGLGAGFSNEDYIRSGGIMVSSLEDVYAQANLIIKVKEPLPQEYALIKPHHTLFTFFHFAASSVLTEAMLKSGATCIAYETIEDSKGGLPLLAPMSEVAGRLAELQDVWLDNRLPNTLKNHKAAVVYW